MLRLSQSPTDPAFVQDPYPFYDPEALGGFDLLRIERVPVSPDVLLSVLAGARAVVLGRSAIVGRPMAARSELGNWL